jgi:hypothetical protein
MRFALLALVASCYHPSVATDVPCSDMGTCPSGQVCDGTTCVTMIDAGTVVDACAGSGCPCARDKDCTSDACSESAAMCLDEAEVLYVSPTGAGSACTRDAPCPTISAAVAVLDATHDAIKVADGTYSDAIGLDGATVLISGEGNTPFGAVISTSASSNGPMGHLLAVNDSMVTIEGLTFTGASQTAIHAQDCELTLFRTLVSNDAIGGVDEQDCAVAITQSQLTGATGGEAAIRATDGKVTVTRTMIDHNACDGVRVQSGASFDIENTFIVANTGTGFQQADDEPETAIFEFDTVADNNATNTTGGLACDSAVAVDSSIVANNGIDSSGACTFTYSLFGDVPQLGAGNIAGDPGFVSATDYHLGAGSPAIDAADPDATLDIDYDGDTRPHGAGRDIGADEH